ALIGGAITVALMGLVRSVEELVVLRLVQGLVTGVVSAASSMVVSIVPRDRLGYAMGMMQTGQWAGISVGPILGGMLEYFVGMRTSFLVTGVLLLIGGLLVVFLVKEQFTPPVFERHGVNRMFNQWGSVLKSPGV